MLFKPISVQIPTKYRSLLYVQHDAIFSRTPHGRGSHRGRATKTRGLFVGIPTPLPTERRRFHGLLIVTNAYSSLLLALSHHTSPLVASRASQHVPNLHPHSLCSNPHLCVGLAPLCCPSILCSACPIPTVASRGASRKVSKKPKKPRYVSTRLPAALR